jgi:DNA polymerase III subunit delta
MCISTCTGYFTLAAPNIQLKTPDSDKGGHRIGQGGSRARYRDFARLIANGTAPYQFIRTAMKQFYQLANLRKQVDQDGKTVAAAVAGARPPLFFGRKALIENALGKVRLSWIVETLDKLQSANLESRKMSGLGAVIVHRALLGIAIERARAR